MTTPGKQRARLVLAVSTTALSLFVLILAIAFRTHDNARFNRLANRNCQAIEQLKAYSFTAIERAEKTLPTLNYYTQHPLELATALAELHREARDFAPKPCP